MEALKLHPWGGVWDSGGRTGPQSQGPQADLHCCGGKMMTGFKMGILGTLRPLHLIGNWSCFSSRDVEVRGGHGVGTSSVPHQHLPSLPWCKRGSIRTFAVRAVQANWLEVAGDLCGGKGLLDDVIDHDVTNMMTPAEATAEAMGSWSVYLAVAVVALVVFAQRNSKAQIHRDVNVLVVHAEANCRDREGIKPDAWLLSGHSQQPGSGCRVGGAIQKWGIRSKNRRGVPSLLAMTDWTWRGRLLMSPPPDEECLFLCWIINTLKTSVQKRDGYKMVYVASHRQNC